MSTDKLSGCRVLVVEDEMMIAMLLEDLLDELGCEVVATAAHPEQAMEAIATTPVDIAILDINLSGLDSYAIADTLITREIPFMFATGYGDRGVKEEYRMHPVLRKPFRIDEMSNMLTATLQQAGRQETEPPRKTD
tara:strand:+ start:458 stop:865 length:408 start_codon:yes stop_codon:yes gene_type:complete